jgi:hypothetical protein
VIIFSSVRFLSKKVTKPKFFFEKKQKPNRNRVKPTGFGSVQFLGEKQVQTGLARFFWFWLGFLFLARFFRVLARFFLFGSVFPILARFGLVFFPIFCRFWFGFFGFLLIRPKPNRPVFSTI